MLKTGIFTLCNFKITNNERWWDAQCEGKNEQLSTKTKKI